MSAIGRRVRAVAQYGVSLALMGAFLYWAFQEVDLQEMGASLRGMSLFWTSMLALTALVSLSLRAWRWVILMRPFAPQVTVRDATLALAICYAANVAVPRSGEALRAVSLKWTRGAQISATLATVVVERILDLVWLVFLFGLAFVLLRGRLAETFPWLLPVSAATLAAGLLALVLLAVVSLRRERAARWIGARVAHLWPRAAPRAEALMHTFLSGLTALHTPAAYAQILVSSALLNAAYVAITFEGFLAFGLPAAYGVGVGAALVIMVVSSVGVIFPTPGAVGSFHAFFSKGLVHLYGVEAGAALASATAVHAVGTLTYAALGVPALLWQRRRATAPTVAHGGRA
ncbi:MAG: lysylphosphatidylglycerol synthase transmembrane domain-containing protein [Candidatus Latescibacterota bacterium]